MSTFKNVEISKEANIYFDGKVTSRKVKFKDGVVKTLGIMSHMVLDDGCVILNLHYDKVLSNTNYSEEFLLNLG